MVTSPRRCCHGYRCFHSYQSRVLKASISVSYSWLFGMLAQKKAELLLKDRPAGTFLVRVNRKKLTYILTYRWGTSPLPLLLDYIPCRTGDGSSCRHVNIVQLPNMRYQLSGETTAHASLEDLVCYHGNVCTALWYQQACNYYSFFVN